MDAEIRALIDGRREVINTFYDLPPEEKRKAEVLLARMEELGNECHTRAEFEQKFAARTMYQEYNSLLLVEFSAYIKARKLQ